MKTDDTNTGIGPLLSWRYTARLLGSTPEFLDGLAENIGAHYAPFDRPKKNDPTKSRRIDNPLEPLKGVQRRINRRLLSHVALPGFMYGGVRGRSACENSARHVGKAEVVTLDIKSFFPSVGAERVYGMWRGLFGASDRVARVLTTLTTYDGRLPQGSPASTGIANLIAVPLGHELHALARRHRLRFTMYVDDLTFSGTSARVILLEAIRAIKRHGFEVAPRKVQVMPRAVRQEVTGNVVNRKLSNSRDRLRALGGRLLRALHDRPAEEEIQRLRGSVYHAAAVSPDQGRRLLRLLEQLDASRATAPRS